MKFILFRWTKLNTFQDRLLRILLLNRLFFLVRLSDRSDCLHHVINLFTFTAFFLLFLCAMFFGFRRIQAQHERGESYQLQNRRRAAFHSGSQMRKYLRSWARENRFRAQIEEKSCVRKGRVQCWLLMRFNYGLFAQTFIYSYICSMFEALFVVIYILFCSVCKLENGKLQIFMCEAKWENLFFDRQKCRDNTQCESNKTIRLKQPKRIEILFSSPYEL